MRVVLKNLKLLPNGKYQYRRVWPQDVRQALPELGRELKRTFEASVARDGAIVRSVALERQFDQTVHKIRDSRGQLPPWEITQRVQAWYNEYKGDFETVLHESVDYDPYGDEVRFTETAADREMEHILAAAAKRSGLDRGGNPAELSAEETLKLEILNKGSLTPPPLVSRHGL
jgi:hypothetical protein